MYHENNQKLFVFISKHSQITVKISFCGSICRDLFTFRSDTQYKDLIQHWYLLATFWGLLVLLGKSCAKPVPRICGSYKSSAQRGGAGLWRRGRFLQLRIEKHEASPSRCPIWQKRDTEILHRHNFSICQCLLPCSWPTSNLYLTWWKDPVNIVSEFYFGLNLSHTVKENITVHFSVSHWSTHIKTFLSICTRIPCESKAQDSDLNKSVDKTCVKSVISLKKVINISETREYEHALWEWACRHWSQSSANCGRASCGCKVPPCGEWDHLLKLF